MQPAWYGLYATCVIRFVCNLCDRIYMQPAWQSLQGVAIKKPDSCSNPLLKKIRQSKCHPLQCSPLPDPYTTPCEFSTVGSSTAGHLVLCCSRVASLLFSLHPRTWIWFLWAQTWFSGREKSRTVLGPENTVDVPSQECCFSPNTSSQIARCVLARCRDESMRHSSACLVSFVAHVHGGSSKHFYNKPDWQSDLQAPNQCR